MKPEQTSKLKAETPLPMPIKEGLIESNVPDFTKGGFISPPEGEEGIPLYDGGKLKPT